MSNVFAERAIARFRRVYGRDPAVIVRAPGRVNLLGGHVDFQECWIIAAALEQAVWLAAAPRSQGEDGFVSVHSIEQEQTTGFRLDSLAPGRHTGWLAYPAGVAWAFGEQGLPVESLDIVITSDLPMGAGLSSSAALEVALALAWQTIGGWTMDREASPAGASLAEGVQHPSAVGLARCCWRAETRYVGVNCGLQDPFVSLHAQRGQVTLLDCRTLHWNSIPLPADVRIVIADTGIRHNLMASEYNHRRGQVEQGLATLQPLLLGIDTLRDLPPETFTIMEETLPEPVRSRCRHVVHECNRVLLSTHDLRRGDLVAFGRAMRASHISSRDDYGSSCYELDVLAEAAWNQPGCYGARLTGAGFGGCIVALVEQEHLASFQENVAQLYQAAIGREPGFIVGYPADGAEAQFYRSESPAEISALFTPVRSQYSEVF